MEVVAIEGPLTDFEVLELLQSPIYTGLDDHSTLQNNRKQFQALQKKYELNLQPHEKVLQTLQHEFNHGQLSETQFRTKCQAILYKTSQTTGKLSAVRNDISYLHKIETTVWMKTKLSKYLNTQACRDQTPDVLASFFSALDSWQSKWYSTIEPSELTMLINLRPTTDTLLVLVLNGFFDRVPQAEARDELIDIISLLPPRPALEYDTDTTGDNANEKGEGDGDENDDENNMDNSDVDVDDENDFDNDYAAQRDQDDDGNKSE